MLTHMIILDPRCWPFSAFNPPVQPAVVEGRSLESRLRGPAVLSIFYQQASFYELRLDIYSSYVVSGFDRFYMTVHRILLAYYCLHIGYWITSFECSTSREKKEKFDFGINAGRRTHRRRPCGQSAGILLGWCQ